MKYRVTLSAEERDLLRSKVSRGISPAREVLHAQILLKVDTAGPRLTDAEAAEAVGVSSRTVQRVRERCAKEGLKSALSRKEQPARPEKRKATDEFEARLIALACSPAPEGRSRWTLRLLAEHAVALELSEGPVSYETVRQTLKKTNFDLTP